MINRPHIHPVILCGGSGTRLWPLSRKSYPKQFAKVLGEESLFQASVSRLTGAGFAPPLVITSESSRFIVIEQLSAIKRKSQAVLIEPAGRNTAPAVLAAALWLHQQHSGDLMLVAPSDHVFADEAAFREAILAATPRAEVGDLVTFGIKPNRPETGYGYLELAPDANPLATEPQDLSSFVEKPNLEHAQALLSQGNYLWNAGIFLFSVEAVLKAFATHAPSMLKAVTTAVEKSKADLGFVRLAAEPWSDVEDNSIDYVIMEKAENLAVMPFDKGWSDLGGWDAVWMESQPDENGVVCSTQSTAIDCRNTLLRSEESGIELVGIGLEDIVAIATSDAVVVAKKSESHRIKDAVGALKAKNAKQAEECPRDHRPWGWFESLAIGERFQVKRIVVSPGAALSLQSHHHRAEHWIVVAGTAKVTINEDIKLVTENQSVYIPLGAVHRLENPGKVPVMMIEVQTGTYLGEDDIIRYDDIYSR